MAGLSALPGLGDVTGRKVGDVVFAAASPGAAYLSVAAYSLFDSTSYPALAAFQSAPETGIPTTSVTPTTSPGNILAIIAGEAYYQSGNQLRKITSAAGSSTLVFDATGTPNMSGNPNAFIWDGVDRIFMIYNDGSGTFYFRVSNAGGYGAGYGTQYTDPFVAAGGSRITDVIWSSTNGKWVFLGNSTDVRTLTTLGSAFSSALTVTTPSVQWQQGLNRQGTMCELGGTVFIIGNGSNVSKSSNLTSWTTTAYSNFSPFSSTNYPLYDAASGKWYCRNGSGVLYATAGSDLSGATTAVSGAPSMPQTSGHALVTPDGAYWYFPSVATTYNRMSPAGVWSTPSWAGSTPDWGTSASVLWWLDGYIYVSGSPVKLIPDLWKRFITPKISTWNGKTPYMKAR